jgi:3-oxoacyl-[acyl-carrier-protein] synthase-1
MIQIVADNIYSPLGFTTADNYAQVKQGHSVLRRYEEEMNLPEPFVASLFDWTKVEPVEGYTRFERICIQSIRRALEQTDVDVCSDKVLLIISTTKGNIDLLDDATGKFSEERLRMGVAAKRIADYFGIRTSPIVVSNACISGLSAQITAMRILQSGSYETAIVVGADVQSRFIISGFQSLKALSPAACRPFDQERVGLNLGEAAATIILRKVETLADGCWQAVRGAVRNDANHISNPSKTAEGCYRALRAVMEGESPDELAFINVHGTSTLYNDEMEAVAIARAGLQSVPLNSLKGYYGHTMGAAGVLETILSMKAVDDGLVLATRGFEESGVSRPVHLSSRHEKTDKRAFVKLLSGFGGCNAALLFRKGGKQ